jgi:2-haloacid dehalogenase
MTHMPPPRLAIFDVNETLSDMRPLAARFGAVGAPEHLLPTWFAATLRDGMALTSAGTFAHFRDIGRAVLLQMLPGSPGLRLPPAEAAEHILDGIGALPLHPDVAPGMRRLRDAGVRLATLTNGGPTTAADLLRGGGIEDLVERNLSVGEVGRWKPAPEPYRFACSELGVEAEEAVMIAVHPWDVDGAMRAGLLGGWLDRDGRPYPAVFRAPDALGRDLTALAEAIGA